MAPLVVGVAAGVLASQEPPRKVEPAAVAQKSGQHAVARCRASQLIGLAITNAENESLGEIQDIVLDGGNRRIAYAVVAFGGFLGMGEKYFALPWRLIDIGQRSADDPPRATLGLDHATLKAAPGFDKAKWPDMANPTWAGKVDDYYRLRNEDAAPTGAAEPAATGAKVKRGVDQAPASAQFVYRRLSQMIGMDVVDADYVELADIEDLVVNTKLATVDGALLGFGGFLGMDENLALVPSEALTLDHEKGVYVFPCSKAGLRTMVLVGGKYPPLDNDEWLIRGRELCAKAREGQVVGDGDVIPVDASGVKPVPFADTYDPTKVETIKGTITTMGAVLVGDRGEERVRLRVRTSEGREVIVYAAPEHFAEQQTLGLRAGRTIEVTGSPARYGSRTVLVASSIVVDGKTAALRDAQGRVRWSRN